MSLSRSKDLPSFNEMECGLLLLIFFVICPKVDVFKVCHFLFYGEDHFLWEWMESMNISAFITLLYLYFFFHSHEGDFARTAYRISHLGDNSVSWKNYQNQQTMFIFFLNLQSKCKDFFFHSFLFVSIL